MATNNNGAGQPAQNSDASQPEEKPKGGLTFSTPEQVHNFYTAVQVTGKTPRNQAEVDEFVAGDQDE